MKDITIFAALADSTRRQIMINLARNSPKTATQLAREYPITRPGIIKHLNILEDAGLVKKYQKGRDIRYILAPEPLSELEQWIREVNDIWDNNLLRLKNMIEKESPDE